MPATGQLHPNAEATALEVIVLWGEHAVVHVAHASPPRTFCVGEAVRAGGLPDTDFVIGREALGCDRLPIALQSETGTALVIPRGARIELVQGARSASFEELAAEGKLVPYLELDGALRCALPAGATARLTHGDFTFVITLARALPRAELGVGAMAALEVDREALPWTLSSVAAHLGMLLLFYFMPPTSSALSRGEHDAERRLASYLLNAREAPEPEPIWHDAKLAEPGGHGGQPEHGERGTAGDAKAPKTQRKLAVQGPKENPHPELPREQLEAQARTAGVIGAIRAAAAWNQPSSIFGREAALGSDAESALGALLGDRIGANAGTFGTGPIGTGRGAGGAARGTIGSGDLNTIGTIGRNGGPGGYGTGSDGMRGRRAKIVPPVSSGTPQIKGSLSKETIRRVVHRHLNEVRYCYEEGLRARPDLQGRVAVQFVVAPSGEVKVALRASSNLADARVEQCIVSAVKRWTFPAPDGGGVVMVTYPFVLQHAGG